MPTKTTLPDSLPINIRPADWDQPRDIADFFVGIWIVTIDSLHSVAFVPETPREPWPPSLPDDTDAIASSEEARRLSLLNEVSVTADNLRAGKHESLVASDGLSAQINYVTTRELLHAFEVLAELGKRTVSVNDSFPLGELGDPFLRALFERVFAQR